MHHVNYQLSKSYLKRIGFALRGVGLIKRKNN